jgi:hypothetical protein
MVIAQVAGVGKDADFAISTAMVEWDMSGLFLSKHDGTGRLGKTMMLNTPPEESILSHVADERCATIRGNIRHSRLRRSQLMPTSGNLERRRIAA